MDKFILANGQELDLTALTELQHLVSKAMAAATVLRQRASASIYALRTFAEGGVSFARPVYQKGYLYESHPRAKGVPRQRSYIGNDPERVAASLALMARGEQYMQEVEKLRHLARAATFAHRPALQLLELLAFLEALKQ